MTIEEILRYLRAKLDSHLRQLATAKKHCEQLESAVEGLRADIARVESKARIA